MHLLIRSFFFLLLFVSFQTTKAQSSPVHYTGTTVKVEGQLQGYHQDSFPNLSVDLVVRKPGPELKGDYVVELDEEGCFSFELENGFKNQQFFLKIGSYYSTELIVDESIHITIDLAALAEKEEGRSASEAVTFGGQSGAMTAYFNQYTQYRRKHPDRPTGSLISILMDQEMTPAQKVEWLRSEHKQLAQVQADFKAAYPSPYSELLENERLTDFYGRICMFYYRHKMPADLLKEIQDHQPRLISSSSMGYYRYLGVYLRLHTPAEKKEALARLLNEQELLPEEKERLAAFLDQYEKMMAEEAYDQEAFQKDAKYFNDQYSEVIYANEMDQFVEELSALSLSEEKKAMILLNITPEEIQRIPIFYKFAKPLIREAWAVEMAEEEWERAQKVREATKSKLASIKVEENIASDLGTALGVLPDGASLYQADQENIELLLSAIRTAHPDKAIVLDIWATWCGPCIMDMRHERTSVNRKKLSEMDVEVVYLCSTSSSDQASWKKKVAELGMGGQHIFLNDQLSKEIMDYFDLGGFPSHVFLNKKGRVVPEVLHNIRNVDFEKVKKSID